MPPGILAFDAEIKETTIKLGEPAAFFVFQMTNISQGEVLITLVHGSCECTAPQLPSMPWRLPPGGFGQIPVVMNVEAQSGVALKTLTVYTEQGQATVTLKTTILPLESKVMSAAERELNLRLAQTNRQAVFQAECARCHAEPAKGKFGKELYLAACAICHEAESRATMVSDLKHPTKEITADDWQRIIRIGKERTLMPAFDQSHGGPLSEEQIKNLVEYLGANFSSGAANSPPVHSKAEKPER